MKEQCVVGVATLSSVVRSRFCLVEYSHYTWIYGISSVNLNSICKFVHKAVKALDDACLNLLEFSLLSG